MVAARKQSDDMKNTINIHSSDSSETRKLGNVAYDLIQFPASTGSGVLSGPSILLYLPDNTEPLTLQNVARATLGRVDRYSENKPLIDLNDHHAKLLGVSRVHAEIVYHADQYFIRDLGSTNGTWVNDVKVEDDNQILLQYGDTIRLGHLVIQVGGVTT